MGRLIIPAGCSLVSMDLDSHFRAKAKVGAVMKAGKLLAVALLAPSLLLAVNNTPASSTLPVILSRDIDVQKLHPGDVIQAKLAQSVNLGPLGNLKAGTKISGHVVAVQMEPPKGSLITLTFDRILLPKPVVITAYLRAIAAPVEVNDAMVPKTGPDRGTPSSAYTTVLVGGDVVYRGGGPVMLGKEEVGVPVYDGVMVRLRDNSNAGCEGKTADLQATWVFGAAACGSYGYSDLKIERSGRSNPKGQIVLRSFKHPIRLRAGSALLLRIAEDAE